MEPNSGIKTWQWVVTIIVIIVLIIIGILVFGKQSANDLTGTDNNASSTTDKVDAAQNRVTLTDQYPGNVVYLGSVQLEKPGWVVIKRDNNGLPGQTIGSMYFAAGANTGKITLSQPMTDGATYYAVLFSDNGDKVFNETTDKALVDANGSAIMKIFKASSSVGADFKG